MYKTSAIVSVTEDTCVGCRACYYVCPSEAITMVQRRAEVDESRCVGCFKCLEACIPYGAISIMRDPNPRTFRIPKEEIDQPGVEALCRSAQFHPKQWVCFCTFTTAGEIAAAILRGIRTPEELTLATGVRAKCGMWCLAPVMRLFKAHGVELERSKKDYRLYPDGDGSQVAIWTISDEVASKYPEYYLEEDRKAVEEGEVKNPLFPDIQQRPQRHEP
jgi:Fe-S-cluster-containing hydrogenase component 2